MSDYKCNLIVPGFGKCGTSSLHSYLALHPRILMSTMKEPQYFSMENRWRLGPIFHNSLFESTEKNVVHYYGESSTTYCASEVALKRIKEHLSDPKIIFILRDPVQRVVSHYRWLGVLGLEKRPILEAIEKDGFGFDPNQPFENMGYKSYLQLSSYSKYVPQWQEKFGENNVLILFTHELDKNPNSVLSHCFKSLGLESIGEFDEIKENRTQGSSVTTQSSLVNLVDKYVPQVIRNEIKKIPLANAIWKTKMQKSIIIEPPSVNLEEIEKISNLLTDELNYYKKLRLSHSLFDPKL